MQADGDEAGDVGHVHDHRRADGLGDRGDAWEVDHARIRARADHDHLRLVLVREREPLELFVVNPLVVFAHAVGNDRVELAGEVQRVTVREVPPWARFMPRTVSPGLTMSRPTCWPVPECGCTLAWSAPKSVLAREMASDSATSTNSQPP